MNCYHCGDKIVGNPIEYNEKNFCCNGCKQVFSILSENGLTNFYTMNEGSGVKPTEETTKKYAALDIEELKEEFINFKNDKIYKVTFFLPAIHCSSCIYLLENLKKLNPNIIDSEANFTARTLQLTLKIDAALSSIAYLLDSIGYRPELRPKTKEDANKHDKKLLIQLGVAGFAFGSVMLWTFPEYLGLDETFEPFRNFSSYLTLLVSIPVLLYSASGYLSSAYTAIKSRQLNLDIPIAIGILVLFIKSTVSILLHEGPGYMDSFTGFVFFLLIGKWFQAKTYRSMAFDNDPKAYFPLGIHRLESNNQEKMVLIDDLKEDDHIRIYNEEIVPCDILLTTEKAVINTSFITGESELINMKKGDRIYAGSRLIGSSILGRVERTTSRSKFASIWNSKTNKKDTDFTKINEDKLTKYFLFSVLIIALIGGATWAFIDVNRVVEIVTAILVVACPCALALSYPFVYGNALRKLGKSGLYFKTSQEIQKLPHLTTLIFDKTGTLTKDKTTGIVFSNELSQFEIDLVYSLTKQSTHPYSKSITQSLSNQVKEGVVITDFKELSGKGISGQDYRGNSIVLGSSQFVGIEDASTESGSYLMINNEFKGKFTFKTQLRNNVIETIQQLRKKYKLHLLSGDNRQDETLFAPVKNDIALNFNKSPLEKKEIVEKLKNKNEVVAFIGDGLNDSEALLAANLAISVADDVFRFTPSCDAIIEGNKIDQLPKFLAFGDYTSTILKVCMIFSLVYNIIGMTFALLGYVTPLFAAILMPLSSISIVFLSTASIQLKKIN